MVRPRSRPIPALAICLCLVLAGCGAASVTPAPSADASPAGPQPVAPPSTVDGASSPPPPDDRSSPSPTRSASADATTPGPSTSTPTPTPTPTPAPSEPSTPAPQGAIQVVNGTGAPAALPVNATLVYARTTALLGADVQRPDAVEVRPVDASPSPSPPPFFGLWGLTPPDEDRELTIAAYVRGPDRVVVNRVVRNRRVLVESTLAHEYVHVAQFRRGVFDALRASSGAAGPDVRAARTAVVEGTAVFVTDAYWHRYVAHRPRAGDPPGESVRRLHANATGIDRWTAAPYRFGYRYVGERADDPAAVSRVYDDPPSTTEQVLHGVDEGPASLPTHAVGSETWTHAPDDARMGELFVRVALATELSPERAAAGADGWGNDVRMRFVDGEGDRGFAWVLRFDDAANATAFGDTTAEYLAARDATRRDGAWHDDGRAFRRTWADPRTVVVFAGDPEFVDGATARIDDGAVVVDAPGPSATAG